MLSKGKKLQYIKQDVIIIAVKINGALVCRIAAVKIIVKVSKAI